MNPLWKAWINQSLMDLSSNQMFVPKLCSYDFFKYLKDLTWHVVQNCPFSLFVARMKWLEGLHLVLATDWPYLFQVMDLEIYRVSLHLVASLVQHILNTYFLDLRSFKWLLGACEFTAGKWAEKSNVTIEALRALRDSNPSLLNKLTFKAKENHFNYDVDCKIFLTQKKERSP